MVALWENNCFSISISGRWFKSPKRQVTITFLSYIHLITFSIHVNENIEMQPASRKRFTTFGLKALFIEKTNAQQWNDLCVDDDEIKMALCRLEEFLRFFPSMFLIIVKAREFDFLSALIEKTLSCNPGLNLNQGHAFSIKAG